MKKSLTMFLQAVTIPIGVGVFALMLWEPHLEGRNVHATLSEIYFNDPFLAYVYAASIFFFVALYHTFRLLGFIGRNEAFSERSVKALRTVKYCALALAASIVAAQCYLFIAVRGTDDIAGGVAMSLLLLFVAVVVATVAAVFQRRVQNALNKIGVTA
jgi:hypothetical protein